MKIAGMHWYKLDIAPGDASHRRLDALIREMRTVLRARHGRVPEEVCVLSAERYTGGYILLMSEPAHTLAMGILPTTCGQLIDEVYRPLPWMLELGDDRWLDVLEIRPASP